MTSNIDQFKAAFDTGIARANRYKVILSDGRGEILNILCDSVTWPGRQILTSERFVNMKAKMMPYGFGQEDLNISFVMANDWYPWEYLNDWQNQIVNNIGSLRNYSLNYSSEFVRDFTIQHLDKNNGIKKQVRIKEAFPSSLNALELGNGNENDVMRISASFSYHNWEIID